MQWYRQARGAYPPQTTEALDEVSTDRSGIYRCRLLEGLPVPLLVQKSDTEDSTPMEAEVAAAVRGLKVGRSGGLSGMYTE